MQYIFLMAGQGSQYPGMGHDLYEHSAEVRELFSIADREAPFDLRALLFEGSAAELQATDKTQIAITVVNLAIARLLERHKILPSWLAGFSLGEYSAMVLAGILTISQACQAVRLRGECMEEASRAMDSRAGKAGLIAVIGISYEEVRQALESAAISDSYIAIQNSPTQTVIGGTAEGLVAAQKCCEAAGALRIVSLRVSGPFHTPLMEEARRAYEEALRTIPFTTPRLPIFSNVTGKVLSSGEEARQLAISQLVSPVLWTACEQEIIKNSSGNLRIALDVGPGSVLCGLWKAYKKSRRDDDIPSCQPIGRLEEVQKLIEEQ